MNQFDSDFAEKVARSICRACDERPDSAGDCRGNTYRWQDYPPAAKAALSAVADDCLLVRLRRIEGYEDAHPQSVAEDAIRGNLTNYGVLGSSGSCNHAQ